MLQHSQDLTQTTQPQEINKALKLAVLGLLGANAHAAENPWQVETSGLFYSESDGRVSAVEPVVSARKEYADEHVLNLKLVVDALTGATPSGALPSNTVQTFTRPSGNGSYTVQPGELPLDDTFHDTRVALSANWEQPLTDRLRSQIGVNFSREYDFTSLGISGNLARDFNDRNTTLSAGINLESDWIEPEGAIPTPFGAMQPVGAVQARGDDKDDKTIVDFLFGVTQTINARSIMQLSYSISQADGYLTDPFKILSVVDDSTGDVIGNDVYRFENRPDKRNKQSLYWQTNYRLDRDRIRFSYRYFWDDWDIQSHTFDLSYRWNFAENQFLEPEVRYYQQSEAEFYEPLLLESDVQNGTLPEFASADQRLAEFNAVTVSVKYQRQLANNQHWNARVAMYQQSGEGSPDGVFGSNAQFDLFPSLTAVIAQVGYGFEW
jgi:hypothetical protein